MISVHALAAPEEQRHGARAGVTADQVADVVDLDPAVELREALLDRLCAHLLLRSRFISFCKEKSKMRSFRSVSIVV